MEERDFIAGCYSIADIAVYPWARLWERQGQDIGRFPNLDAWLKRVGERPGVIRGMAVGEELSARQVDLAKDAAAQAILFGNKPKTKT